MAAALEVAVPLWELLLAGQFPLLSAWCEFVQVREVVAGGSKGGHAGGGRGQACGRRRAAGGVKRAAGGG